LNRGNVEEIADPEAGRFQCLVKVDACAICTGTDSSIIRGDFPWLIDPPFILGHESTGTVIEVGEGVESFEVGQRVTRPAGILPGDRRDGIGSLWGGFSQLGLIVDTKAAKEAGDSYPGMAENSRTPLPKDVDPLSAALSVNQREILSIVDRLDVGEDSKVVVMGSGYNGLLFSLFLKHAGAGVVLMTGNAKRESLARKVFEADFFLDYRTDPTRREVERLLGGTPTHLIDAVGTRRSVGLARDIMGPRTRYGRYGLHEFDKVGDVEREIRSHHPLLDLRADEASATDKWYALWKDGFLRRPGIYDGTMPLKRIREAFEILEKREAVKLVVEL